MQVEMNEKLMRELFKKNDWELSSVMGTTAVLLEDAVRELEYVRRSFKSRAENLRSKLDDAIRLATTAGREPNSCGALQGADELEVLNGRIHAGRERVYSLITIAKKVGVLDANTEYVA